MNLKKWMVSLVACVCSCAVFAIPVPQQDNEETERLLQQYTEFLNQAAVIGKEIEKAYPVFDEQILPVSKHLSGLVLEVIENEQTEFTPQQTEQVSKDLEKIQNIITPLAASALQNKDVAQIIANWEVPAEQSAGFLERMYLSSALIYFAQNGKLSENELAVLSGMFFSADEMEEE